MRRFLFTPDVPVQPSSNSNADQHVNVLNQMLAMNIDFRTSQVRHAYVMQLLDLLFSQTLRCLQSVVPMASIAVSKGTSREVPMLSNCRLDVEVCVTDYRTNFGVLASSTAAAPQSDEGPYGRRRAQS